MTAVDVACDSSSEPSSHDSLISAMMHPEFYPKPPDEVSYKETHISHLFFAGDLVYKVKKAVHFSFLDYSSLAKRRHYLQEELRLNRRLAPSVYLGVLPIAFDESGWRLGGWSEPREYTLVMRRLPEKRMLRFLIDTHQAARKDDARSRQPACRFSQQGGTRSRNRSERVFVRAGKAVEGKSLRGGLFPWSEQRS
jgi:Uncharacterized protein conserved in bacteria